MSLRIIAGELRGRRLRVPPGLRVRPTADRVRESLFNILGGVVEGAAVLDPYAGTGALGFESLSRGARAVTFFEADRSVLQVLRQNARTLGVEQRCRILAGRAERLIRRGDVGGPFNLVLADPPYDFRGVGAFLNALATAGLLAPGARLVHEHDSAPARLLDREALELARSARYGRVRLDFYSPV